jgi:hypothetical protein
MAALTSSAVNSAHTAPRPVEVGGATGVTVLWVGMWRSRSSGLSTEIMRTLPSEEMCCGGMGFRLRSDGSPVRVHSVIKEATLQSTVQRDSQHGMEAQPGTAISMNEAQSNKKQGIKDLYFCAFRP